MKRWCISLFVCMYLVSAAAFAGGDRDAGPGNGGDPVFGRAAIIQAFINDHLRDEVIDLFQTLDLATIADEAARAAFADMLAKDVVNDVKVSPFKFAKKCVDNYGASRSATAVNGQLGGPICFNLKELAKANPSHEELVALSVHEYAHHFGFEDKDHTLYKAAFDRLNFANQAPSGPLIEPGLYVERGMSYGAYYVMRGQRPSEIVVKYTQNPASKYSPPWGPGLRDRTPYTFTLTPNGTYVNKQINAQGCYLVVESPQSLSIKGPWNCSSGDLVPSAAVAKSEKRCSRTVRGQCLDSEDRGGIWGLSDLGNHGIFDHKGEWVCTEYEYITEEYECN